MTLFFQIIKKIVFLILGLAVIYLLAAFLLSIVPVNTKDSECFTENDIYITSNGVHLDIVLPVNKISQPFLSQLDVSPKTQFIAFGWGDKNFYAKTPEWSDLTIQVAFKALFLKSESAMHVTCYRQTYNHWEKVQLCPHQLNALNNYIINSFKKNETGELQKTEFSGYTNSDTFYKAKGSFTLFKTCNVWTNIALKKSGVKTSIWSPFDFGVLYHVAE